ncbi:MAG: hypothetical protein JKY49_10610 [Cohaesibacteraceae bacterium]|nr:hypothetical protein [Cohaesibacteraceae bacterium]
MVALAIQYSIPTEVIDSQAFREAIFNQTGLLRRGRILEAFDAHFSTSGVMYANDRIFGRDALECRAKQEPFIGTARSIDGRISDVVTCPEMQICCFRNHTRYVSAHGELVTIDGLHWQQWFNNAIVEERYYSGALQNRRIAQGILTSPESLPLLLAREESLT